MSITRKNLFDKLNNKLFTSIESATTFCKLRGNPYVELVHWLNNIFQQDIDNDMKLIARFFSLDTSVLVTDFEYALASLPSGASTLSDFSYHIELAIERAWVYASLERLETRIRSAYLLMAMLNTVELRRVLLGISAEFNKINVKKLSQDLPAITQQSEENDEQIHHSINSGQLPGETNGALSVEKKGRLKQFTTDLTALAREGKTDPVLGRNNEIATMIDILLRRRQNNPLLTGEAGVGKTAVVEGLAQAISQGDVPPALQKVRLLSLDIIALSAGASMKGEFEARLQAVLEEAIASEQPVILFIDEIHTLIGAGGNAGTGDAANLLKPFLARGQLRTIGATTWSEFKRHIEKDPALTRRFQVLQVDEPQEAAAVVMLRGLIPVLEKHHNVWIMEEALQAAVKLSHRYIPARQLPDKAISLLDTACARVANAQHTPPMALQQLEYKIETARSELALLEKTSQLCKGKDEGRITCLHQNIAADWHEAEKIRYRWLREKESVSAIVAKRNALNEALSQAGEPARQDELRTELISLEQHFSSICQQVPLVPAEVNADTVATIVSNWTGIPVGQMLEDDIRSLTELPQRLSQRVTGQQQALNLISESIVAARTGLSDPNKPVGVFMLAGPSGVGKTETALAIAEGIYGGEQNLIVINMSEYQEAHTISSLKGSPPGYVGYGEGGVLTEAVRRRPYSVILLDEIEKAHSDVHELFYQVFDKGQMEDGEGRYIDFKNTIILLTSNVGSELISNICAVPETTPEISGITKVLRAELLKVFPAAFLGRVNIVPYLPLQFESLSYIVSLHLRRLAERLYSQHKITFNYQSELVNYIIEQSIVSETGARNLVQFIERKIAPMIGGFIIKNGVHPEGCTLNAVVSTEDGITLILQKKGARKSARKGRGRTGMFN
ncbi:type VI secretion system ATPase TssH [Erwinia amylovora]